MNTTFCKDVSFDLETLALTADATILSVAAVNFDMTTGNIGRMLYTTVEYKNQERFVDINTFNWWKKQNPVLRKEVFGGTRALKEVLEELNKFIRPNQMVWGNGANFDIAILEHAYKHVINFKTPWKFWNGRDMRTRIKDAEQLAGFKPKAMPFEGRKHRALDDAVHQAKVISAAYQALYNKIQGH